MNVKLLAVVFICAFVAAEARPRGGQRGGGHRGPGSHSHDHADTGRVAETAAEERRANKTLEKLENFCAKLESGNITNDNSSFDDVFVSLDSVCSKVAAYLGTEVSTGDVDPVAPVDPIAPVDPVQPARRKRSRHGGSRGGHDSGDSDESSEEDHEAVTAVGMLFRICDDVEDVVANLPADMDADLVTIFTDTGAVCEAAELVRNPQ